MEIIPQSSVIDAEVRGLDLSRQLKDYLFFGGMDGYSNYALNDYHGHRRVMQRIIVEGEVPR